MRRLDKHDGVLFEGDWLPLVGLAAFEAKGRLKVAWGIPYFAQAIVNGRPVPVVHLLRRGDRLEFVQRFGFKAGDDIAAEQALAEALLRSEPDLAQLVHEVAALPLSDEQRLSIMVLRVLRWMENNFGPATADAVAVLHDLAHRFDGLARNWKWLTRKDSEGAYLGRQARSPNVRVDERGGELVIDGVHQALDSVYLAILACLKEAHGACVSRAEMRARSRTLKDEERLDRVIAKLKQENKKVGDLIQSVPGKGYRLISQV